MGLFDNDRDNPLDRGGPGFNDEQGDKRGEQHGNELERSAKNRGSDGFGSSFSTDIKLRKQTRHLKKTVKDGLFPDFSDGKKK